MKENVKTVGVHNPLPSLQALHESKFFIENQDNMGYKERFIPGIDQWQKPLLFTKLRSSFLIAICCRKST